MLLLFHIFMMLDPSDVFNLSTLIVLVIIEIYILLLLYLNLQLHHMVRHHRHHRRVCSSAVGRGFSSSTTTGSS